MQQALASSLNFAEYTSVSSLTLLSTSSRFTFSFRALNGACVHYKKRHSLVYEKGQREGYDA